MINKFKEERIEKLKKWKIKMSLIDKESNEQERERLAYSLPIVELCNIKCRNIECNKCEKVLAARHGLEPRSLDPNSSVLPLDDHAV